MNDYVMRMSKRELEIAQHCFAIQKEMWDDILNTKEYRGPRITKLQRENSEKLQRDRAVLGILDGNVTKALQELEE